MKNGTDPYRESYKKRMAKKRPKPKPPARGKMPKRGKRG